MKSSRELVAILHNIRSLHNVGSVFRTADGFGISKLYLTGYTPKPIDELGRVRREIHKTALGAEESVEWSHHKNIQSVLQILKKERFTIVALEQMKGATHIDLFRTPQKCAFVIGNEVRGLSSQLLKKCDKILEIPMCGTKESFNVSVAFGIAAYELTRN